MTYSWCDKTSNANLQEQSTHSHHEHPIIYTQPCNPERQKQLKQRSANYSDGLQHPPNILAIELQSIAGEVRRLKRSNLIDCVNTIY